MKVKHVVCVLLVILFLSTAAFAAGPMSDGKAQMTAQGIWGSSAGVYKAWKPGDTAQWTFQIGYRDTCGFILMASSTKSWDAAFAALPANKTPGCQVIPVPVTSTGILPAPLLVSCNFIACGLRAPYTGDTNGNAIVSLHFKKHSDSIWLDALTPPIDRRTLVGNPQVSNAANMNQARGSIVGLTADTPYDFQVIWTDPDGLAGTGIVTATAATATYNPPAPGRQFYLDAGAISEGIGTSADPFKTEEYAELQTSPGDTINCQGTFPPMVLRAAGTEIAYRVLRSYGAGCRIAPSSTAMAILANYWRVIGIDIGDTTASAVGFGDGVHHVYFEDSHLGNVATEAVGQSYWAGFVLPNNHHIYLLRNSVLCNSDTRVDGPYVDGIYFGKIHDVVFQADSIIGSCWDAIGNGTNNSIDNAENVDIDSMKIRWNRDDPAELDGGSINVRFSNGDVETAGGPTSSEPGTAISATPANVGPVYIFRSHFRLTGQASYGLKTGIAGSWLFWIHDSIDTAGAPGGGHECFSGTFFGTFLNSICQASGNVFYNNSDAGGTSIRDYILGWITNGAYYADHWNGANVVYETLVAFQTATGQQLHGKYGDPQFIDTGLRIAATSPAVDAGVYIPNFNGPYSAWPIIGVAPDMGWYEVGSVQP